MYALFIIKCILLNPSLWVFVLFSVISLLLFATIQWVTELSKWLEQELHGNNSKRQVLTQDFIPYFQSDFQFKNLENPLAGRKKKEKRRKRSVISWKVMNIRSNIL